MKKKGRTWRKKRPPTLIPSYYWLRFTTIACNFFFFSSAAQRQLLTQQRKNHLLGEQNGALTVVMTFGVKRGLFTRSPLLYELRYNLTACGQNGTSFLVQKFGVFAIFVFITKKKREFAQKYEKNWPTKSSSLSNWPFDISNYYTILRMYFVK